MNTIFCSNVFLIVLLVALFTTQIFAQNLAFCDHTQPKKMCEDILKSDSAGKSATTIEDVAMIMLTHATSIANEISDELTNQLKLARSSWGGDVVALVYCSKYYQDAIGKLANSKKTLDSRNYNAVKNLMSVAMSAVGKCDQDFKKFGKNSNPPPPLGYMGDTYIVLCRIVLQLTTRK
jgi:pectinesterase inhibitor-like protein